jgi:hypothetical protein
MLAIHCGLRGSRRDRMEGQTCAPMAAKFAVFWVTEAAVEPLGHHGRLMPPLKARQVIHRSNTTSKTA